MSKPVSYQTFSELVVLYRNRRHLTIRQIHEKIKNNCLIEITYDAVRKYDRGLRAPSPEYVVALRNCLRLTEDEWKALVEAIIGDLQANLFYQYDVATNMLRAVNSPCVSYE